MWAQGGGGKLPLKPQRLSWLGAGARLFFSGAFEISMAKASDLDSRKSTGLV